MHEYSSGVSVLPLSHTCVRLTSSLLAEHRSTELRFQCHPKKLKFKFTCNDKNVNS